MQHRSSTQHVLQCWICNLAGHRVMDNMRRFLFQGAGLSHFHLFPIKRQALQPRKRSIK